MLIIVVIVKKSCIFAHINTKQILNIMKTIRITRTVFPKDKPSNFNEWSAYFFGMYATELAKVKQGWERNEYKPKKK